MRGNTAITRQGLPTEADGPELTKVSFSSFFFFFFLFPGKLIPQGLANSLQLSEDFPLEETKRFSLTFLRSLSSLSRAEN